MKVTMRWWSPRKLTLLQKFSLLSFLCILGITVAVSASIATFLTRQLVRHDAEVVADLAHVLLTRSLPASYFTQFPLPHSSLYEETVAGIAAAAETIRVILYDAQGTILWSDDAAMIGRRFSENRELRTALRGEIEAKIIRPGKEEHQGLLQSFDRLEEIYLPVRYQKDGPVVGVLEIYRHPPAFFASLDRGLILVWLMGGGGGGFLYLVLFSIVRKSSRTEKTLETELASYTRTLEERVAERTQEISQKARDLSILYAVSSTINQSLDLQTILDRALEQILEVKGYDAAWIRLLNERQAFPTVASRGISKEFMRYLSEKQYPGTKGGKVMQTGEPLIIYMGPDTPPGREGWLEREGLESIAFLPIPLHDRPIGTLNLACRTPYRFTPEDIQLLSSIAQQIGAAIGNAQLYSATSEREREARILYETNLRLREQTDLDSLLTVIVEGAVRITHASFGSVGLPEGDTIVMRRLFPRTSGDPPTFRHTISQSVAGLTYTSGQPQIVSDAPRDPRVNQEVARPTGLRSAIFAPVQSAGQVIGVLCVCNKEGGPFTADDLVLLTTFANHAAAAIENARLHAETLKREREASILYRTSTHLHGQTDLEALLTTIVEGAIEIANATCGGIGQRMGEEIVLRPIAGFSLLPGETEIHLPLESSAAGLTYGTGEPLIVNDLSLSPCAAPIREAAKAYGLRNFLCVPLKSKNRTLGVIKVCNKKGEAPFTDDDLRLLTTFATEAALTIDNTQLFHEIKTTKDYLENLIESSVDAIVTLTPRGILTFVSQGGQRMLGYSEDDLVGTSVLSYWARGRKDLQVFRKLLADKGRVQNFETELSTANGTVLSASISASLLHNAAGQVTGILAIVRDVTGLRKLQEQMARSERLAATGLLAAGVAHEVGNPLACISSLTQVLLPHTPDPRIRSGLQDIQTHARRIDKILQDLTHLARPAPFQFRKIFLNEIICNAVTLARYNPAAHGMRITTTLDPAPPPLRGAPDHLLQVFLNLILNAADAGGDLTIRTTAEGETVHAIFSDTGRGMSAAELRRLFDPFYSTKDAEHHLGLGLFVSHQIVREHGGTISTESEPGRGTTFTLVLPVER